MLKQTFIYSVRLLIDVCHCVLSGWKLCRIGEWYDCMWRKQRKVL